ncbi:fungal-specific transcription factor domain-containing protein [Xylogone sp. PMI_703]|nr:fungal-specific transcription factor domain-containing protein [Xylogone sp. PMI_703]
METSRQPETSVKERRSSEVGPSRRMQTRRTQESSSKRPKGTLACEACRYRKVRCDGVLPVCGACRRRRKAHVNCVYPDRWPVGISPEYVVRLQNRIQELEALQTERDPASQGSHNDSQITSDKILPENEPWSPGRELFKESTEDTQKSNSRNHSPSPELVAPPTLNVTEERERRDAGALHLENRYEDIEGVDGMGNIGATEHSYLETSSSAASFMEQVKNAMAARLSSSIHGHTMVPFHNDPLLPRPGSKHSQHSQSIAQMFALPPRRAADDMIKTYFHEIHILYPFLIRDRFMRSYQAVWTGEDGEGEQRLLYCIMNLIFALSCQIKKRDAPDEMAAAAAIFYKRAVQLLQFNVIGGGSLELVQSLLLMGQYLQSTEWPHRCWVVIGLAIRISQGLGLHMKRTTASLCQLDRELARRLWHGCVFMDRMVSMTLGRPMMISKCDALGVPFPQAIDDEYLSSDARKEHSQPAGAMSKNEFFLQSLKLYIITHETLSTMYRNEDVISSGVSPSALEKLHKLDFNTIVKIDTSISEWYSAVPKGLKICSAPTGKSDESIFSRQANILRLRCLQVQILLFRPILSLLLVHEIRSKALSLPAPEEWLPLAMGLIGARKCIRSALEMIDIIFENQNFDCAPIVEPLPAWWYEVFFIYTAATALIPARVYSYIRGDIPQKRLSEGWLRSLEVLRHLSQLSSSATRCLAALELINGEVFITDETVKNTADTGNTQAQSNNNMNDSGQSYLDNSHGQMLSVDPILRQRSEVTEKSSLQQQNEASGSNSMQATLTFLSEQHQQGNIEMGDNFANGTQTPLMQMQMQMQDFTWLESLPADLLAGEYEDFSEMLEGL